MDIHEQLSANYVLVDLTINSWSAEKTDKEASRRTEKHEGAVEGAAKVVKNLLAGNNALHKSARGAQTAIRTYLYSISSPWTTATFGSQKKGERIVLASKLMEVMVNIDHMMKAADETKREFIAEYAKARDNALIALGGMASLSDYPTPEELEARFGVSVAYKPIPALADYSRLSVPVELAEGMAKAQAEENARAMQVAQDDAHERLCKQLDRMTEQLTKVVNGDKTKLYETLVTNMREVASVMEAANFSASPAIAQAVSDIRDKLVPKHRDKDDFKDETLAARTLEDIKSIRGVIANAAAAPAPVRNDEHVDLGGIDFDEAAW